jgi:hypothetical protein
MLQDNAPRPYCPSMNSKTISNFIKWKREAKGSILKGSDNVPIKDIDNQIIKCEGGWKDPKNVGQLNSAIVSIKRLIYRVHYMQSMINEDNTMKSVTLALYWSVEEMVTSVVNFIVETQKCGDRVAQLIATMCSELLKRARRTVKITNQMETVHLHFLNF